MGIASDLLTLDPLERRPWISNLDDDELAAVLDASASELGTPYGIWRDDPDGWVEDVLGEFLWSRQKTIMRSAVTRRRTVAVASHGPGKTHTAARSVAHWLCCWPQGTATAVTTAPRWRQVKNLLWPHLHRMHGPHELPGRLNIVEWKFGEVAYGYGFAGNQYDESAVQGIHADHLLIVVDEGGGIPTLLGRNLDGLMTGDAHLLVIGNPPTDEPGTWFEMIAASELWNPIHISAYDSPNFCHNPDCHPPDEDWRRTPIYEPGEPCPVCGCPTEYCPVTIAKNLVDAEWVGDVVTQYGIEDPYFIARVKALFPQLSSRRVIPVLWAERAMDNTDRADSDWQRLGVDVAAGGGDEMAIAHLDGWECSIVDHWSASESVNQTVNADRVVEWVKYAAAIQEARGYTERRVRVKVDSGGVGAGTADILEERLIQQGIAADVVRVNSGEAATEAGLYANRRAEMWWTLREVIRDQTIWLKVGAREKAQLTGPQFTDHQHGGRIFIEPKDKMKVRTGMSSPDRADAIGLAVYEPEVVVESQTYGSQLTGRTLPARIGAARRRSL